MTEGPECERRAIRKVARFAAQPRIRYVPPVDSKTHRRGSPDTTKGRLAKVLLVSVLLHVPLTPWAALVGLFGMWSTPEEAVDSPPITGIPIDIIEDPGPPAAPEPPAVPDTSAPSDGEPATLKPVKKPSPAKLADAGAPDAEPDAEAADAGANDAGLVERDAGPKPALADAGAISDAGLAEDAGPKPLSDPALVAGVQRVTDPNANVRLMLYTEKIRANPLGARVGPLLGSLYQWRDFFGPAGVDPIRDIDQIYIVGSQLRDSSNVIAILKHHLPAARMRAAVDHIVHADKDGEWLDAGVPVASAHADGAERRFVLANAQTVVVTPPSAYASTLAARKMINLVPSKGPEAAMIYLATPWRAFMGLPIKVPQSIRWARIRITPTADGGATAEIEAEDDNPEVATEDAAYLTRTADALSQLNLGFLGSLLGTQSHRFIEHIGFSADGKMIRGTASVTADQLNSALDLAGAFLSDRQQRRARPAPPAGH